MDEMITNPASVIEKNIAFGVAKTKMSWIRLCILAVMAGGWIAFGAASSSLAMHTVQNAGLGRLTAGVIFPVGLMMIVLVGGELFTGDCMMAMGCLDKKSSWLSVVRILVLVFLGNFVGAALIALLVFWSGQLDQSSGALGAFTIKIAVGKVSLSWEKAFVSGILCNILVCAAVLMTAAAKDLAGKILAIFFPIMAFVVAGFEHCVANMYYIPAGIFAASSEQYRQVAQELYGFTAQQLDALNWGSFLWNNLLPVTLGNLVGGAVYVGGLCYLAHRKNWN